MSKVLPPVLCLLLALLAPPGAPATPSGGLGTEPPASKPGKARIINGLAVAPANAPKSVRRAIDAANMIAKKPYRWAGGHAPWRGSARKYIKRAGGFDCSGSVSFVLGAFGGRWLTSPLSSSAFLSWGKRGRGRWFTVYSGSSHAYLLIAGLRFDTSGLDERGTRWSKERRGMSGLRARTLR